MRGFALIVLGASLVAAGCGGAGGGRYDGFAGAAGTGGGAGGTTGGMTTLVPTMFMSCAGPVAFPDVADLTAIATLPDPFTKLDGTRMTSPDEWPCRREELKALSQYFEYGFLPPPADGVTGQIDGTTLTVNVSANGAQATFTATVTLPPGDGPFPAFIQISSGGPVGDVASFTARGYAFIYLETKVVADDNASRSGAFYTLYPNAATGVLMAWAWGVHRIVDVLQTVATIDATKLAVNGFSRWGKGALLAGAFDERIALTVPSSSGLSGTGQFRYFYEDPSVSYTANEKIGNAWSNSPYWYTPRFGNFVSQVQKLPYDQHAIMDLVAPRALMATQGEVDYWTNPRGTVISWSAAKPMFDYVGQSDKIAICYDNVDHMLTPKHVQFILDFADVQLNGAVPADDFQALPSDLPDDPTTHPWTAP